MPLSNLSDAAKPYAKQLEADIETYLESGNKDMSTKCLVAQDILRHVSTFHMIGHSAVIVFPPDWAGSNCVLTNI